MAVGGKLQVILSFFDSALLLDNYLVDCPDLIDIPSFASLPLSLSHSTVIISNCASMSTNVAAKTSSAASQSVYFTAAHPQPWEQRFLAQSQGF